MGSTLRAEQALSFLGFTVEEVESFQRFVKDVFETNIPGENNNTYIIKCFRQWSRFNPGEQRLHKSTLVRLIQIVGIQHMKIKLDWEGESI